jgi:hypothetical protein
MTEISPRLQRQIRLRIIKGIQRNGDRIFTVSQMKCPVKTGNLKTSGYKVNVTEGCKIGYSADYACIYETRGCGKNQPRSYSYVVLSNGSTLRLGKVKPGMLLDDGNGNIAEVIAVRKFKADDPVLYKIVTESGKTVVLTHNHIIPTRRGDTRVEELELGDEVTVCSPSKSPKSGHDAWNKGKTSVTSVSVKRYSELRRGRVVGEQTREKMRLNHWSTKGVSPLFRGLVVTSYDFCYRLVVRKMSGFRVNGSRHFCSKYCCDRWKADHYGKDIMTAHPCLSVKHRGGGGYRKDLDHYVRSRWEANIARLLKHSGLDYYYEPDRFDLGDGRTYCPDFYVPSLDVFIEVKGYMYDDKCKKFSEVYPQCRLVIIDGHLYNLLDKKYQKEIEKWEPRRS